MESENPAPVRQRWVETSVPNDDWWGAGADSAEHYQQILLDSLSSTATTATEVPAQGWGDDATMQTSTETGWGFDNPEPTSTVVDDPPAPVSDDSDQVGDRTNTAESLHQAASRSSQLPVHESFDDIHLRLTNEFTPVVEHDWDTLIYIGPPAQEHGQDDDEYHYIQQHFSRPYLMNSATLRAAGSAELANLLGPTSARAQRRLKKLGLHVNLPGKREPKYYVDLRPPQDDDEAVLMITEMSCTPGVLSWYKTAQLLYVDKSIVCGTDSLNITAKRSVGFTKQALTQELEEQPAYSPLRHHLAIERLLHTLSGGDPKLNSAPKVWSFVVIAKHLGCASHPRVMSEVYSWLFIHGNSNFIQNNPEVTYRIATSMKTQDLARVSYALLVGEKAFLQRGLEAQAKSSNKKHRVRPLCHLDDDEINRIDHGAQSFGRRIQSRFMEISNEPIPWMTGSVELVKLLGLRAQAPEDQRTLSLAWTLLRDHVRNVMYQALTENFEIDDFIQRTGIMDRATNKRRILTHLDDAEYGKYSVQQRLLTRAFWEYLKVHGFSHESGTIACLTFNEDLNGMAALVPGLDVATSDEPLPRVATECLADTMNEINHLITANAVYYVEGKPEKLLKSWPEVLSSQVYDSARLNMLSESERDVSSSSNPPGITLSSKAELVKAMQSLDLNPKPSTRLVGDPKMRESMKMLSDEPSWHWHAEGHEEFLRPAISLPKLLTQLKDELAKLIDREILTPGWANDEIGVENEIPIFDMESLLCVNGHEWKYLALWAGGLDDGSGGVFVEEHVPDLAAEEGFQGGKRGLGNPLDDLADIEMGEEGYSVVDGSEFDDIATDEAVSTVGKASRVVTVGTRTTANTVISLDE